ncbi:nitroreductase family protein [Jatrophihabitans sp. DSM 45814]
MELKDAVRYRMSTAAITDEAPDDDELTALIAIAAHAPDHAGLRPWRLVSVRGKQRDRLGAALVTGFGDEPGSAKALKTARKVHQAPLLIGIVATLQDHPKVPRWEQISACAAMVTTLELLLFEAGWTAMWRTGPGAELKEVHAMMGVSGHEKLLGWLYVGRTDVDRLPDRPRDPDVGTRLSSPPDV